MKLKKTFAGVVAAAVAVSSLAVSSFAADTSTWNIAISAYGEGWSSDWAFTKGDDGALELEATIAEIAANDGVDPDALGGMNIQVWNAAEDDVVAYTITVTAEDGTVTLEDSGEAIADSEGVAVLGQYSTAICYGTDEFAATDTVTVKVEAVEEEAEVGSSEDVAEPVEITLANGGVMVNDGGVRVNLYNPWGDETMQIIDITELEGTTVVSVKFSVTGVTDSFTAWLAISNFDNVNYWGEGDASNSGCTQTPITITEDGVYVVTVYLDEPYVLGENNFLALQTDIIPDADDEALENVPQITILAVAKDAALTVDAEEEPVDVTPGESSGTVEEPTDVDPGDNVDTGVTLAVVPAALAAAALAAAGVATKKRK